MDERLPPAGPTSEARQWGMFCHLAAFLGFVFPFGNLIGPLVVWQLKKDRSAFIDAQGKESVNFQITVTLASLVCFLLFFILIGLPLLGLVAILAIVFTIIAAIKANEGVNYRYPLTLRLIR
ncbi:DUF4870 domain-containing protein [Pseudomonas sp. DC3000-4b1]|uniref:DUF4870 domain-containing protein n=1 Tax=unclassified Pseudomonas TaxID=196821 RepID=UPI003CF27A08